jgi:hypothetical protein
MIEPEDPNDAAALEAWRTSIREDLEKTRVLATGEGYSLDVGGACPVQGYGEVDGFPAYFRARGESWSLEILPLGADPRDWEADAIWRTGGEHDGDEFSASWLEGQVSAAYIAQAVAAWRSDSEGLARHRHRQPEGRP